MHQASLGVRSSGKKWNYKIGLASAAAVWLIGLTSALALAAPTTGPSADDQPRLTVGRFSIQYIRPLAGLPSRQEILASTVVNLHRVRGGYTAPQAGGPSLPYHLTETSLHNAKYSVNAIKVIQDSVRKYINDQGIIAVFVYSSDAKSKEGPTGPDALDYATAAATGQPVDIRLVIVVGVTKQVRAILSGDRVTLPFFGTLPYPEGDAIRKNSPVKPGQPLYQEQLQDYLSFLNRQNGRHIDMAVSSADTANEDDVTLDYLVHLNKPWTVYAQGSNTGTQQTNEWAERFGFIDNELTGHDDVFTADFNTDSFRDTYTVDGSYEVPVFDLRGVRAKIYGAYGKFTSTDLGIQGLSLHGYSSEAGGEGTVNVYQYHDLFVDAFAGAKSADYSVRVTSGANVAFLLPYAGLRLSRDTALESTHASASFIFDPTIPHQDVDNIEGLGLVNINHRHYEIVQADASESFFIEPLLDGWDDRDKETRPTAANELYFSGRGQYVLNDKRVIAELQETVGGLYSVRGYPESAVAGDTVIFGTAEYRFHIPRILGIASGPSELLGHHIPPPPFMGAGGFYYQPRAADTPGDWDLVAKAFVDGGYAHLNKGVEAKRFAGISDAGLVSTGLGLDLKLRDNVTISTDWGIALTPVQERNQHIDEGSNRFNFVFSILY